MKMWMVLNRRPMDTRDRKVYVFRYITMAPTKEEAIAVAKEDNHHAGGAWEADEVDGVPCYGIGCFTAEPNITEREAQAQTRKAKAAR